MTYTITNKGAKSKMNPERGIIKASGIVAKISIYKASLDSAFYEAKMVFICEDGSKFYEYVGAQRVTQCRKFAEGMFADRVRGYAA